MIFAETFRKRYLAIRREQLYCSVRTSRSLRSRRSITVDLSRKKSWQNHGDRTRGVFVYSNLIAPRRTLRRSFGSDFRANDYRFVLYDDGAFNLAVRPRDEAGGDRSWRRYSIAETRAWTASRRFRGSRDPRQTFKGSVMFRTWKTRLRDNITTTNVMTVIDFRPRLPDCVLLRPSPPSTREARDNRTTWFCNGVF